MSGACASCVRRSWLLFSLAGPLECYSRDRARLISLLALADEELIQAAGGRRKAELRAQYETFQAENAPDGSEDLQSTCSHRVGYPAELLRNQAIVPVAPMLSVEGRLERLVRMTAKPVVAILGSTRASDYGIQMASSLARGLAASGITVASSLTAGVAGAAHAGALEIQTGEAALAVLGSGLHVPRPVSQRSLYERVVQAGCTVSELPRDCRGRQWGQIASERILVALARVVVVIEAEDTPRDLSAALMARTFGRTVAAIPGPLTSPLSQGAHALLMGGASLVRGPEDVLELLHRTDTASAPQTQMSAQLGAHPHARLEPRLLRTLERVGLGSNTLEQLTSEVHDASEILLALSELELMGLLTRGRSGRYQSRYPLEIAQSGEDRNITC